MSTNYDINMKKILDDYYKCIGAFNNCVIIYNKIKNLDIPGQNLKEKLLIKKGMEEDLLSNLGKVGEKAFKYIIGLENLKVSPNQDSNTFESLWKKSNTLKEFAKKHGIAETDKSLEELLNYYDENHQKAHNFDYWFSVIDLIMKDTSKKFEKFMQYIFLSDIFIKYCEKNNEYKYSFGYDYNEFEEFTTIFRAAIFPSIMESNPETLPKITENQIKLMLETKRIAIKKNGDIFTRLRYSSNNITNRHFNLDEVYELITNIIFYINMIHYNSENLDFNLDRTFAKVKAIEHKEKIEKSEEEINNLFSLESFDEFEMETVLFNCSYDRIIKLINFGLSKDEVKLAIDEGLTVRSIDFFYKQGIFDFNEMRKLLDFYNENGHFPNNSYNRK